MSGGARTAPAACADRSGAMLRGLAVASLADAALATSDTTIGSSSRTAGTAEAMSGPSASASNSARPRRAYSSPARKREALADSLLVALDRPAGVGLRRGHAPRHRQLEHRREYADRLVGLGGHVPETVVQCRDMGAVDLAQSEVLTLQQASSRAHLLATAIYVDII